MAYLQELAAVHDTSYSKSIHLEPLHCKLTAQVEALQQALLEQTAINQALKASETHLRECVAQLEAKCTQQQIKLKELQQRYQLDDSDISHHSDQVSGATSPRLQALQSCTEQAHQFCAPTHALVLSHTTPEDTAVSEPVCVGELICAEEPTTPCAQHLHSLDQTTPFQATCMYSLCSDVSPLDCASDAQQGGMECTSPSQPHSPHSTHSCTTASRAQSQQKHPLLGLLQNISTAFRKVKQTNSASTPNSPQPHGSAGAQASGSAGKKAANKNVVEEVQLVAPSVSTEHLSIRAGNSPSSFSSDGAATSVLFEPRTPCKDEEDGPVVHEDTPAAHQAVGDLITVLTAADNTEGTCEERGLERGQPGLVCKDAHSCGGLSLAQQDQRTGCKAGAGRTEGDGGGSCASGVTPGSSSTALQLDSNYAGNGDHDFLSLPLGPLFSTASNASEHETLEHETSEHEILEPNGDYPQDERRGTESLLVGQDTLPAQHAIHTDISSGLGHGQLATWSRAPVQDGPEIADLGHPNGANGARGVQCHGVAECSSADMLPALCQAGGEDDALDQGMWDGWSKLKQRAPRGRNLQAFQIEEPQARQTTDQRDWATPWAAADSHTAQPSSTIDDTATPTNGDAKDQQPAQHNKPRLRLRFNLFRSFTFPPVSAQPTEPQAGKAGKHQSSRLNQDAEREDQDSLALLQESNLKEHAGGNGDIACAPVSAMVGAEQSTECAVTDPVTNTVQDSVTDAVLDASANDTLTGPAGIDTKNDTLTSDPSLIPTRPKSMSFSQEEDSTSMRVCTHTRFRSGKNDVDEMALTLARMGPAGHHRNVRVSEHMVELPVMDFSRFRTSAAVLPAPEVVQPEPAVVSCATQAVCVSADTSLDGCCGARPSTATLESQVEEREEESVGALSADLLELQDKEREDRTTSTSMDSSLEPVCLTERSDEVTVHDDATSPTVKASSPAVKSPKKHSAVQPTSGKKYARRKGSRKHSVREPIMQELSMLSISSIKIPEVYHEGADQKVMSSNPAQCTSSQEVQGCATPQGGRDVTCTSHKGETGIRSTLLEEERESGPSPLKGEMDVGLTALEGEREIILLPQKDLSRSRGKGSVWSSMRSAIRNVVASDLAVKCSEPLDVGCGEDSMEQAQETSLVDAVQMMSSMDARMLQDQSGSRGDPVESVQMLDQEQTSLVKQDAEVNVSQISEPSRGNVTAADQTGMLCSDAEQAERGICHSAVVVLQAGVHSCQEVDSACAAGFSSASSETSSSGIDEGVIKLPSSSPKQARKGKEAAQSNASKSGQARKKGIMKTKQDAVKGPRVKNKPRNTSPGMMQMQPLAKLVQA